MSNVELILNAIREELVRQQNDDTDGFWFDDAIPTQTNIDAWVDLVALAEAIDKKIEGKNKG